MCFIPGLWAGVLQLVSYLGLGISSLFTRVQAPLLGWAIASYSCTKINWILFPQVLAEPWFEWKQDQQMNVEKIVCGGFSQRRGVVSFFSHIPCTDVWGKRHWDDTSQLAEVFCHHEAWGTIANTTRYERSTPWWPPEGSYSHAGRVARDISETPCCRPRGPCLPTWPTDKEGFLTEASSAAPLPALCHLHLMHPLSGSNPRHK